tara:strand:- start:203 stop:508 length:306 start_codon:yes stop_codon:yes gene_type:complete
MLTVIGLFILYFYAEEINPQLIFEEDHPAEEVKINGRVEKLRESQKAIFLQVSGEISEIVDVVVFKDQSLYITEGDLIEIVGRVENYQGKQEIIAETVNIK